MLLETSLGMPLSEVLAIMQARICRPSSYFGVLVGKCPIDVWTYQEILWELKPQVIVEVGTGYGGSALIFAHLLDHIGKGRVISLDMEHVVVPEIVRKHPRITLLAGEACQNYPKVKELVGAAGPVLVNEDSGHTYENTLNVLRTYGQLVTPGSYMIVEDTNCHHGVEVGPSPGPYEAVATFLQENHGFQADRSREGFLITWNPNGYLRKVS